MKPSVSEASDASPSSSDTLDIKAIFLHILRSSENASCSLDDTALLQFFHGSKERTVEWFNSNNMTFRLDDDAEVYVCVSDLKPCTFYWKPGGCTNKRCV